MGKWTIAAFTSFVAASAAHAGMDYDKMPEADGLAKVIHGAKHCGYSIDDAKLESYFVRQGLDEPEMFSHITNMLSVLGMQGAPSAAECTMARMTGKKIGILAP